MISTSVRWSVAIGLVLLVGQAPGKGPAYNDPNEAGEDFAVQGEYIGEIGPAGSRQKYGAQVIALGRGKFQLLGYPGGLPGAGWDRSDPIRFEGKRQGAAVSFLGPQAEIQWSGGMLNVFHGDREPHGTLRRVHRKSPTWNKPPPQGAVVLFDGTDTQAWRGGRMTPDGLLMQGTTSREKFGSHRLHLEFRLPFQPQDGGQARGNSGLYLQSRYEIQMLDSFGLKGKHNECGGIYSIKDPDVNMCLPPLAWQTYDVDFRAAEYDADGKLLAHPRITVRHNGVVVHDNVELPKSTTAAPLGPGPEPGPVYLQDHSSEVRYRNIWVVRGEGLPPAGNHVE